MKNTILYLCTIIIVVSLHYTAYASEPYLPKTISVSDSPDCIGLDGLSAGERLSVLSLQGIVNRDSAEIYTFTNQDRWVMDLYAEKGYVSAFQNIVKPDSLWYKYMDYCKKCVICDPGRFHTVNLAANLAGVEDRIIVTPDIVDRFVRITGCDDLLDLTGPGFESQAETFRWYRENIYPQQSRKALCVSKGGLFMFDVNMDYAIEFRLPVFWLPGKSDEDYDAEYNAEIEDFLHDTPVNIPVLGFWTGVEKGKDIGYGEYNGVKLAGRYGKFTIVNTWVGNYSYHSGVKPVRRQYSQDNEGSMAFDKDKKYVALVMTESGDAPCYFMYNAFFDRQWNDPKRGHVPLSYGITPSLRLLAPAVLEHIYDTRSENDCFFCSISGAGYCYPFEDFGISTYDRDSFIESYFLLTAEQMEILGMDALGIYTHPGADAVWSEDNHYLAEKYISRIPGLKTIVSGMHRNAYTGDNAYFAMPSGATVFNTVTHWPQENYVWDSPAYDKKAVCHLEDQITRYGGRFTVAMFYSWYYTPSRLFMLMKRLEKEDYVFVTLRQLDSLYREYQKNEE